MRIDVLTIPGCPNGPVSVERVRAAVVETGASEAIVEETVVSDVESAETFGMHGSPTILIDGHDPFAQSGTAPSMSCRLYRSATGPQGCPSVHDLVEVIRAHER